MFFHCFNWRHNPANAYAFVLMGLKKSAKSKKGIAVLGFMPKNGLLRKPYGLRRIQMLAHLMQNSESGKNKRKNMFLPLNFIKHDRWAFSDLYAENKNPEFLFCNNLKFIYIFVAIFFGEARKMLRRYL